ncbi:MAG: LacI family DNA-binding transcriptional regulator, partial [Anaerolineae bacterium]|nr:LacI family DNA-binding transcriptional regulator [Anaerolineae bacterium]
MNKEDATPHNRPATMRDVAKLAGVSQPTVSRVLNQSNTAISISEETRTKVMAAVEELNYRPNVLARGLRTQHTQMIAVMIADISNSFFHPIARAIQDVAHEHNYDVMIANSDQVYSNELHFIEVVTRRPVDGVIMVPIHISTERLGDFVIRTNTPIAVLGQHVDHPLIDVVFARDDVAIYNATHWLVKERGHRELGLIGSPHDLPPGPRRTAAFMRAMTDLQLPVNPLHIVEGDFTLDSGRRAIQELLARNVKLPTVLVALNDLMAIGAILALQEAGYSVPDDVAVLGFDDIAEASIVRPMLTTIAQDPADIGFKLATCLFERMEDPQMPHRIIE